MRSFFNPIRTALLVLSLMTLGILAIGWPADAAARQGWSTVAGPAEGGPRVIGHPGGGCLIGAQQLPQQGTGYQAVELERRRHYGHPSLHDYIQDLGKRVDQKGFGPILVGDMAQPRGGPMSYGHVSHQSGLDVDVWFRLDLPALEPDRRAKLEQPILVDHETGRTDPERWTDQHAELVHLAATDERVARIFVDAAIKHDLCARSWEERSWLRKIRPWPKHDAHLHVRLHCPADSPDCIAQDEPPPGDGCAELEATAQAASVPGVPRSRPALPPACAAVLEK